MNPVKPTKKEIFLIVCCSVALLGTVFFFVALCANAAELPKLTDAQKLAIRNAQIDYSQVQLQMQQMVEQYRTLESQKKEKADALNDAVQKAMKAAGVKAEDYTLDKDLNLVQIPKAASK